MNRLYLIAGIVILIMAMVFLNQGIKKASPTDEDLKQQAQQEQQDAEKAQQKAPPAAPAKPSLAASTLPADETVGDPATAAHHIQIGWIYDEANLKTPATLTGPLEAIRDYVKKSGGADSAEIVNLDVPMEDRSAAAQKVTSSDLGIFVDGKPVLPGNLSDMHIQEPDISKALDAATGKK